MDPLDPAFDQVFGVVHQSDEAFAVDGEDIAVERESAQV